MSSTVLLERNTGLPLTRNTAGHMSHTGCTAATCRTPGELQRPITPPPPSVACSSVRHVLGPAVTSLSRLHVPCRPTDPLQRRVAQPIPCSAVSLNRSPATPYCSPGALHRAYCAPGAPHRTAVQPQPCLRL